MFATDEMMQLLGVIIIAAIVIAVLMTVISSSGGSTAGICRSMVGAFGDLAGSGGFQC